MNFRRLSPVLDYGNDIAKEMLNANHELVESLPALYQNILTKSRRNRREDFATPCINLSMNTLIRLT